MLALFQKKKQKSEMDYYKDFMNIKRIITSIIGGDFLVEKEGHEVIVYYLVPYREWRVICNKEETPVTKKNRLFIISLNDRRITHRDDTTILNLIRQNSITRKSYLDKEVIENVEYLINDYFATGCIDLLY